MVEQQRLAKRPSADAIRTIDDFMALEAVNSEKEAYQPFLAPYLRNAESCLVIGAGWGVVERRWVEPFRSSGRRLLLTAVNEVVLEPVARLWGVENMAMDALNVPSDLFGRFDLVYAILVEYVFNDAEYGVMLSNMKRCLDPKLPSSRVLLIASNVRAGTMINPFRLAYRTLDLDSRLPTKMLRVLGRRSNLTKFSGWQRSLGAHHTRLRQAGLKVTRVVPLFDDGSFWGRFSKVGASKALGIEAVPA